jgi:hypothetical protein
MISDLIEDLDKDAVMSVSSSLSFYGLSRLTQSQVNKPRLHRGPQSEKLFRLTNPAVVVFLAWPRN